MRTALLGGCLEQPEREEPTGTGTGTVATRALEACLATQRGSNTLEEAVDEEAVDGLDAIRECSSCSRQGPGARGQGPGAKGPRG